MSAITGIFYRDGRKVDPELIKKMNNMLSHRGPDGSAVWCEGPVALGHQMLWTTPESLHEKLPFEDGDSGLVITSDARIDNRDELSKELNIKDEECVSDSYFILKAYEKWGENCPEHLLGDFAFAIWDKNEEKLFCARDHMGVKPFYYYLDDEKFVFGTEIKALFCVSGVPCKLNEKKIAFYLSDIYDKKLTFYKDIYTLKPANSINIDKNEFKVRIYWELDSNYHISLDSDEDYFKTFMKIFTEAVQCRLRSAYPVGFELSGGLDSSSVVCLAKFLGEKNIKTFSMIYDKFPEADESSYIQKVLDLGDITHHFIFSGNLNPLNNIETILWYQDQPFFTPNVTNYWNLNKKIKENDVRVLLTGHGGDDILSFDLCYFKELFTSVQWIKLINEIKNYSHIHNKNGMKIFIKNIVFPLIPLNIKKFIKRWIIQLFSDEFTTFIFYNLNEKFAGKFGGFKRLNNIYLDYYDTYLNGKTLKEVRYKNIDVTTDDIYKSVIDRVNSAFYIESRHPFLDKRLIEFCYGLPSEMIFRFGFDKYILRKAMADVLPKEIQWRADKAEFSEVYYNDFRIFGKDYLKNLIHNDNEFIKDYINLEKLEYLYEKLLLGKTSYDLIILWYVSLLSIWLQQNKILLE